MKHLPNCISGIGIPCSCDLLGKSPISQLKESKYKPEHLCDSRCNNSQDCPLIEEENDLATLSNEPNQ